jgi:hypothetical protein
MNDITKSKKRVLVGDRHTVETPRGPMVFEAIDGRAVRGGPGPEPSAQTWKAIGLCPVGYAGVAMRLYPSRRRATRAVEKRTRLLQRR